MSQNLHDSRNTLKFNRSILNVLPFGLLAGMDAPVKRSMLDSIPKIKTSGRAGRLYRERKNRRKIQTESRRRNR